MKDNSDKYSFRKMLRSFRYAFAGIGRLLGYEHNARIHSAAAIAVVVCGFLSGLSAIEWAVVLLCIGAVFAAEAFNTALEILADRVNPEFDEAVGRCKDMAAAAVLFVAIASAAAGLVIFVPKIMSLF